MHMDLDQHFLAYEHGFSIVQRYLLVDMIPALPAISQDNTSSDLKDAYSSQNSEDLPVVTSLESL
jgi:hypothetical protein